MIGYCDLKHSELTIFGFGLRLGLELELRLELWFWLWLELGLWFWLWLELGLIGGIGNSEDDLGITNIARYYQLLWVVILR